MGQPAAAAVDANSASTSRGLWGNVKHYGTCKCAPWEWTKTRVALAVVAFFAAALLGFAIAGHVGALNFGPVAPTGTLVMMIASGAALLGVLSTILYQTIQHCRKGKSNDENKDNNAKSDTDTQNSKNGWCAIL